MLFKNIWAKDFIVNTPFNRITLDAQTLLEMVKSGRIKFSSFIREIEQIRVLGDVVFSMGNETVVPVGDTPAAGLTIKRRYTNIWMKQNGSWILIARHANNICQ